MSYVLALYILLTILLGIYGFMLWYHAKRFSLPSDPLPFLVFRGYVTLTLLVLVVSNVIAWLIYKGVL